MNIKKIISDAVAYMSSANNPGAVTASQTGSYSKTESDNLLNGYLNSGTFVASKYGDNSWPAPNVLGNWRGGQRMESYAYSPLIQEPDGSFTLIENATDGVSAGVYFTYFKEYQRDGVWQLDKNPTPVSYTPPILKTLPGDWHVNWLGQSEGNTVLWGRLFEPNTNQYQYFIALTNGTGDPNQHICTKMTTGPVGGVRARPFVLKDKVYFLIVSGLGFSVQYVNVSDIVAGNPVTPTDVQGWTTTGINTTRTATNVEIASVVSSADPDEDAMGWKDTNAAGPGVLARLFCAAHPTENKVRVILNQRWRYNWNGGDLTTGTGYVIDVDFDAKTAVLQPECRIKVLAENVPGTERVTIVNNGSDTVGQKLFPVGWNWHGEVMVTDSGRVVSTAWSNEGLGSLQVGSCGTSFELTNYEKLDYANFTWSQSYNTQIYRRFGALVGGNGYFKAMFPDNGILLYSTSTNPVNKETPQGIWSYTRNETAYDAFTYKTDWGVLKGFFPSSDQVHVDGGEPFYASMSMLCTGVDRKITKVDTGTISPQDNSAYRLQSYRSISLSGNKIVPGNDGIIRISDASLFDDIFTDLIEENKDVLGEGTNYQRGADLWIPPTGARSYPPLLGLFIFNPTTLINMVFFYNVTLTLESGTMENGVISSAVLGDLIYKRGAGGTISTNVNSVFSAGFVYEHFSKDDGTHKWSGLLSPAKRQFNVVGGNYINRAVLTILPGENKYTADKFNLRSSASWYHGVDGLVCVGGVGPAALNMGYIRSAGGAAFYYQKLNVTDDYHSMINLTVDPNNNSNFILISSLVTDEFKLYFTDVEDCLIDSVYHQIPAQVIDLKSIDPSPGNKTFYVYLALANGEVSYVITPDANANHKLYIGWVKTDSTQIIEIEIFKATKFDW